MHLEAEHESIPVLNVHDKAENEPPVVAPLPRSRFQARAA
jgi:hypothetical protein